jgi:predicted nucleic acid-binding protein
MILVDTNVISEAMRIVPDSGVVRWLDQQPPEQLYTTAISRAEIYYGIEIKSEGKKRTTLARAAEAIFGDTFADRILPFDDDAARIFAKIAAWRRRSGKAISEFDAQIAAIARSHNAAIATRNTYHFEDCGVSVINPWGA